MGITGMTIPKPSRSTKTTRKRMPREAWRFTEADLNRCPGRSHAPVDALEVGARHREREVSGSGDALQLDLAGEGLHGHDQLVSGEDAQRRDGDLGLQDLQQDGP